MKKLATPQPKTSRYTVIKGRYWIHNPNKPRQGPQPDGDTIRFEPDSLDLVRKLPRFSGIAPDIRNGQINVRYEGIDALETISTARIRISSSPIRRAIAIWRCWALPM
jgi:hypothetical protein